MSRPDPVAPLPDPSGGRTQETDSGLARRVERLVARGEGPAVEFKAELPPRDRILATLLAFANTRGGTLLVGVTDTGEVAGLRGARAVRDRLVELCRHRCTPPVEATAEVARLGLKHVVVCTVPESDSRPHFDVEERSPGRPYLRVGASTRRGTERDLKRLAERPSRSTDLGKLERRILDWVREIAGRAGTKDESATVSNFARRHNLSESRAKRAFEHLLRDGWLVASGRGKHRFFSPS